MRTLLALALVLAACGCSGDAGPADGHEAPPTLAQRGPDAVVLRVPRSGGEARVYSYPALDSAIWTATERLPATERVLGFDPEAGSVVLLGARAPVRLDLRLGAVAQETPARLTSLTTTDGSAIYGIDPRGVVVRMTPTGTWRYQPPHPASEVFPQPDGSLLIAAPESDTTTVLWRVYPPDTTRVAEQRIPRTETPISVQAGDRVYYAAGDELTGVRSRDLTPVPDGEFEAGITRMVPTPSGDRIYVLGDSATQVEVFDRYRERVTRAVELPGLASDLRMDPLGRLLLVRAASGDSIWVIALGTDELVGSLASSWRADLPAVAPDGSIALVQGNDVVIADGAPPRATRRITGGARDLWYFFHWNGFRPRASGIDDPVTFAGVTPDSMAFYGYDSLTGLPIDTMPPVGGFPTSPTDSLSARGGSPTPSRPTPPAGQPPAARAFTVQFYALMVEERARELAQQIQVDGQRARVVPSVQAGTPVYRVVLGPYPTREEADRVGSRAGHVFWVFEGLP